MTQKTILLIEDQAGFRKVYSDVLESNNYRVITAEDGEKGLQLAQAEKPDLILLDLILPKMPGMEVLQKVRADDAIKSIPIVILSVLGDKDQINDALSKGANDYTVKGFYTPREILAKIQPLLEGEPGGEAQVNLHHLVIDTKQPAIKKLMEGIGLGPEAICPHCESPLVLELVPDFSHTEGHWFNAHFVCRQCKKQF